jgi:hypothetical protein
VPGTGLRRLDARVGDELGVGAQDAVDVAVEDDRAVHLGQLAQPGRREVDVQREAAAADRVDDLVVAEHDEGARAAAQDSLQTVAQRGARRDGSEGGPQQVVVGALDGCDHGPFVLPLGGRPGSSPAPVGSRGV